MRVALGIEYSGTDYQGWQIQNTGPTVQRCCHEALSQVGDSPITVQCAGRTDAGVHALDQVVHFDTATQRDMRAWVLGSNTHLPQDIRVRWASEVCEDFHARFSAIARSYEYWIDNRPVPSAVFAGQITFVRKPLDVQCMQEAAQCLIGEHNFNSLRAVGCQAKSPVRTIEYLRLTRLGHRIKLEVKANAFLHHMVRNIVGVLLPVGYGERPVSWVQEVLDARDRRASGITAPAAGLYLYSVDYPAKFDLPRETQPTIF